MVKEMMEKELWDICWPLLVMKGLKATLDTKSFISYISINFVHIQLQE